MIEKMWRKRIVEDGLPIILVLVLAAFTRTWLLEQNGFGREYYAAGVRSMLAGWHNVFYNAFDPGGFVSIDKPPLGMWLQAAGGKLLGFSGIAVLLPQVAVGLVSIVLLYRLVDRPFGRPAALVAALVLALTPVSIAVDRSNNTESLLIAVLLVATLLGIRAALSGGLGWLCGAMATIGVGFNVKMAAALPLALVLALSFSLAHRKAPIGWHLLRQGSAALVLAAVSLVWLAAFDLTPAGSRPYAGSTRHNSMLELALVHNGAARFSTDRPPAGPAEAVPVSRDSEALATPSASGSDTHRTARPALTDTSPTGPLRLFRPRQAAQAAWLLPLVLVGILFAWRTGTAMQPGPSAPSRLVTGVLVGWLALYWLLLSFAGGPVHTYYLAVLAPPLAAFAGIAIAGIWQRWRGGNAPGLWIGALAAAVIGWQGYLFFGQAGLEPDRRLLLLLVVAAVLTTTCAIALVATTPRGTAVARVVATAGIAGLLAMPVLAASSVVLIRPNVAAPFADIARLTAGRDDARAAARARRQAAARKKLTAFLTTNQGTAKYLVAMPNAIVAAPLILATGRPVMAMGGYLGTDPILTPERLGRLVADGEVRFVMLGGFTLAPERQQAALEAIGRWVQANGAIVDERLWRIGATRRRIDVSGSNRVAAALQEPRLFDLRARAD